MKLDPNQASFGRHETFPLRYSWMKKGFDAICEHEDLFRRDDSIVRLGVGRNMVNAIRHWLLSARVISVVDGIAKPTQLGHVLLGETGDPYFEDETTLWVLHWLIASNSIQATGFYWFFNEFAMPAFSEKDLLGALQQYVQRNLMQNKAQTTLKSDISTLLRMYTTSEYVNDSLAEEHLDSPLSQLRLITATKGRNFLSSRQWRPEFEAAALGFAILERFEVENKPNLSVRDLLYGGSGYSSPATVFRLSEDCFMHKLEELIGKFELPLELRDTGGIHQLYCIGDKRPPEALEFLSNYYRTFDNGYSA